MKSNNFDFLILNKFLQENENFLTGARIQKIQQPTRQELIFTLRNQGKTQKFYVNINPTFFHVCLISDENYKKRFFEKQEKKKSFAPPPMFCMLLRKYLESSKIAKVQQPQGERILEFYFETYNELSEKIYLCLAVELMGKHSNVVLYNYDTNVIIGCAHNVGSDKSRERELIGGLPYVYPSKSKNTNFVGLSDLLKEEEAVNDLIDNYFADLQEKEKIKSLKSNLLAVVRTKLRKINSSLEKIQNQSTSKEKADLYRKKGDLILANLFHNQDFLSKIEIFDYETNSPIIIKLDKTKTLKENANQFYKLYNKAKTAHEKTEGVIENAELEKEYLEQILYSFEAANDINDLFEIQEEVDILFNKSSRHPELVSGSRKRTQIDNILNIKKDGFIIFIGKNNKQNDYIVSKLARDEDLWFHVHNCAGSHVLLRVESGQTVTDEVIFECAKLAKEYSSAKLSSKVGVIYTKVKNLKKPPGAPLGYVIYKGEKEIIVD